MNEPKTFRAIMLSSTFTDLKEHRQRAIEAISKLGYLPRVMEYTGARSDDDVIESSLRMVRDSTAYVGVIGQKYGQTPYDPKRNPDRLSISELEFNEAVRLNRPIVLFVMGDEHPVKIADIETDPDRRKKLLEFREHAKRLRVDSEAQRVYETFESLEQFSTTAAIAIGRLVQSLQTDVRKEERANQPSPRPATDNLSRRTPHSVMLSSTYRELIDHRTAVREAMLTQRLLPIAMEDDAALPDQDLIDASLSKVDEADAYIGLISYRYGQIPESRDKNPDQLSLVELEFRRALSRRIPICMFIMHEDHPVPRRAVGEERGLDEKFAAFLALAKKDRIYAEFKSVEDLKTKTVQSLARLRHVLDLPERLETSKISPDEINRAVELKLPSRPIASAEELHVAYDKTDRSRWPCQGATTDDLNMGLVRDFASKVAPQLVDGILLDEALPQHLGLLSSIPAVGRLIPHYAAILCFSDAPEKYIPQARSSFIAGDENTDEFVLERVSGSLQRQVVTLVQLTLGALRTSVSFDSEGQRVERPEIPTDVIREVISNAISHRDYQRTGTVQVRVRKESVEVTNPGSFPANFLWDAFLASHGASSPNDAFVAYFLTIQLAFEGIGRGFRIFREYIKANGEDSIGFEALPGPAVTVRIKRSRKFDLFTERSTAISNIPMDVPAQFLGREQEIAALDAVLKGNAARAVIAALHGLRGVGKTTLAAAYAERYSTNYRATWWIRAETASTMRADLVGLGVQLGWVAVDAQEEPAIAEVLQRLRRDGKGILLIYDNALGPNELSQFLPRGAGPHVIITSNAPNWRGVAAPVEIGAWPKDVGADYLLARTGRMTERAAALALSELLAGLPLAHEQAAAYCERLGVSLAEYVKRFHEAPAKFLDDVRMAPSEYHDGLTVAKTFALAMDEAAKLHPAAEPLIVYAALLAPEPIPLFLFSEARAQFTEPLASTIGDYGLDEAVAALRALALVDREAISDERNPAIKTDCIRLNRLVRQIAAERRSSTDRGEARQNLAEALAAVYPANVFGDVRTWPRARRLDPLIMPIATESAVSSKNSRVLSFLLDRAGLYRAGPLGAYEQARPLFQRALAIREETLGPTHLDTAQSLNNLGYLLRVEGDFDAARNYLERALEIREKTLGSDHPDTALSLNNLGYLLQDMGDFVGARPYIERALAIREKAFGPDHPAVASSLNNLGILLDTQGDYYAASEYFQRALDIDERALGPDHPDVALTLNNLGNMLRVRGELTEALSHYERALAINEKVLGREHPATQNIARSVASVLESRGRKGEAAALRTKFALEGS